MTYEEMIAEVDRLNEKYANMTKEEKLKLMGFIEIKQKD